MSLTCTMKCSGKIITKHLLNIKKTNFQLDTSEIVYINSKMMNRFCDLLD